MVGPLQELFCRDRAGLSVGILCTALRMRFMRAFVCKVSTHFPEDPGRQAMLGAGRLV